MAMRPLGVRQKVQRGREKDVPLGASSRLLWLEFDGPLVQAVAAMNMAIANARNTLATIVAIREGCDPTHYDLDVTRMVLVRKAEVPHEPMGE